MKNYKALLWLSALLLISQISSLSNKTFLQSKSKVTQNNFVSDQWQIIINKGNNRCLKFNIANSNLVQATCAQGDAFLWKFVKYADDGSFAVMNKANPSQVFDVSGGALPNSTPILAYAQHNGNNQRWFIRDVNSYIKFVSKHTNKCIDVPAGTKNENAGMQQWDCLDNDNQLFTVKNAYIPIESYFSDSILVQIVNRGTNKCMKYNKANGNLVQSTCTNDNAFSWNLVKSVDGTTYFVTESKGTYVLDVSGSASNNGNPILTYAKHGGANQRWAIKYISFDWSYVQFINKATNKCLDVPAGNSGDNVNMQLWECIENNNQQYYLRFVVNPKTLLAQNTFFKFVNRGNGKCLYFNANNSRLLQNSCSDDEAFAWKYTQNDDDETFVISSKKSANQVFDVSGAKGGNGVQELTWEKHNGPNQRWFIFSYMIEGQQFYQFQSKATRQCVDVPAGDKNDLAGMQQWDCQYVNNNQLFSLLQWNPQWNIKGYIKNSTTNTLIPNSELTSNKCSVVYTRDDGKVANAKILDGSIYSVDLNAGKWSISVKCNGYADYSSAIEIPLEARDDITLNSHLLSPLYNGWRIVLTWGAEPQDLDAYLITNGGTVSWKNRIAPYANLDVDFREGYGPETISVDAAAQGKYIYFINNYSKEVLLAQSGAKVQVYRANTIIKEVFASSAQGQGNFWNVGYIDTEAKDFIVTSTITTRPVTAA